MDSKNNWLEISLVVDGELAEAVADAFTKYIPDSVVIQSTQVKDDPDGEGEITGPLRVCGYIEMNAQYEDTRQKIEQSLAYLNLIQPIPEPGFQEIKDENWMESWKKNYQPIEIGESLRILPAWFEKPDDNRMNIVIDPGMAFGTGTHPTSQVCLMLMEKYVKSGETLIDVGCGSGILSIGARLLGAKTILGVDTDKKSIEMAYHNASMNDIVDDVYFYQSSSDRILKGDFELQKSPLVVANILSPILIRLLDEEGMADLMEDQGLFIFSGILEEHSEPFFEALARHNLGIIEEIHHKEWLGIVAKKC